MQANFKRNLIISFGFSLLILLISSSASYYSIRNLLQSNNLVNHTQQVIYNVNEGKSVITEAQNSVRGFLITGKTRFLDQQRNARQRTESYFSRAQQLTIDNPAQQKDFERLAPLKQALFDYLALRIERRTQGYPVLEADLQKGKTLLDAVYGVCRRIEAREQELLRARAADAAKYASFSVMLIIAAALIALIISIVFFMRILNDFRQRGRLQLELQQKDIETEQRIKAISEIAAEISKGNYDIRVSDIEGDTLGSVGESLNSMGASLSDSFKKLSDKEWLQAGIAALNNVMLGEKTIGDLTKDIIEFLATYTDSAAGALYLLEDDALKACAGYGFVASKANDLIAVGQGISGQAVASGKLLEFRSLQPGDITISYAMGEIKPAHVVALPLIDIKTVGTVELASIKPYNALQLELLEAVANNIGIAIKAAQNRKWVQDLLEETQAQSEELRIQHTELESMNAELETQTEKLQASEEELRVQQEELRQTNEELAERSALLEEKNTEIQKKSEDLEISTRYKSEFLANMSHELRTPLNSILLLSRLLSENTESNMSAEQIEFAKVIQSSGNGLLGLIDEILDLSKIEAGKMDLEFLDISTKEITDNLKGLFAEVAKSRNIGFRIITHEAPLVIRTDKMRLEQILKNLISNGIKFTSKGEVTLEIKRDPNNERTICFIVKDTGIGIPKDKQPLIFEAFQQADGSTKRKFGGTGLGLSISRELTRLLHGTITLESEVDQGSEFTLCLPVIGSPAAKAPERKESVPETVSAEKLKNETYNGNYISPVIPQDIPDDRGSIADNDKIILIVEDDANFAKSLLTYTRKRGYKGIVSVRGDHALNLALTYRPAGILLDIQLPVKSGWEVMEELKNNQQTKHIPVHIMSSHKLKQESLLKGAVNFLDKPVAFEQMPEVFRKIEQIINSDAQKVLIIEDNPKHAKALAYFLESHNINAEIKSEVAEGVSALQQSNVNCVILDMGIPDKQAYEILEGIKKNRGLESLPVIVFTGKSLSVNEEVKIKKYADSIVVKTAHSYQRMLDEVSLFLHLVERKKPDGKKDSSKNHHLLNNILRDKTVLVVDDDVRNIYSLTKALEGLKMNVVTAIDGNEALHMLEEKKSINVVLLDMMMPNMDGYETARRIREKPAFKNLPVIAVTAKAMTGDREKCINAGASDYITKPVDIDQLLSLLRVWLYDKA